MSRPDSRPDSLRGFLQGMRTVQAAGAPGPAAG